MYIESKAESLNGLARIGRVTFSKTRRTLYYRDQSFMVVTGYKYNHLKSETGEPYWISGPRRDGKDRLYISNIPVEIDEDVREEYWNEIRKKPENRHRTKTRTEATSATKPRAAQTTSKRST